MEKRLYTASQAREKLGNISGERLKRLVNTGQVKKVEIPGNTKRGAYDAESVDELAAAIDHFIETYSLAENFTENSSEEPILVQAQSIADIEATIRIDRQYFGDDIHSPEKRKYWFKICPNGDYILKHHGLIVGYFSIQGIKPEAVERLFISKKGNPKTQADDMTALEVGYPLQAYVSMIGVKKDETDEAKEEYGRRLLFGLRKVFIDFGKQGIDIRKIWAKSGTVPGIRLCRSFGFSEFGYINNEQIGFMLDLENSNLSIAKQYRNALTKHYTSINSQI